MMQGIVEAGLLKGYSGGLSDTVLIFRLHFVYDTLLVGVKIWTNVMNLKHHLFCLRRFRV